MPEAEIPLTEFFLSLPFISFLSHTLVHAIQPSLKASEVLQGPLLGGFPPSFPHPELAGLRLLMEYHLPKAEAEPHEHPQSLTESSAVMCVQPLCRDKISLQNTTPPSYRLGAIVVCGTGRHSS